MISEGLGDTFVATTGERTRNNEEVQMSVYSFPVKEVYKAQSEEEGDA